MPSFIAFQTDAFQDDAFQAYIIETPIGTLTSAERVYARAYLEAVFSESVAEKVFVEAISNNITIKSAIDRVEGNSPRQKAPTIIKH